MKFLSFFSDAHSSLHQQDNEINANIGFSDLGVDRYRLMRLEKELTNKLSLFQCKLFRVASALARIYPGLLAQSYPPERSE
jgi:hypothetical protein